VLLNDNSTKIDVRCLKYIYYVLPMNCIVEPFENKSYLPRAHTFY
jgi:hypothetical protein